MAKPFVVMAVLLIPVGAGAAPASDVRLSLGGGDQASYMRLLLLFATVSLAPTLLAVLTSFARIIVVLFFLRAGLGSQQLLPNQVLIGLAILLSVFTMARPLGTINQAAVQPLLAGDLTLQQAASAAEPPIRKYLSDYARPDDLALLQRFEDTPNAVTIPFPTLASAYVLSELRAAFLIGFVIYLPFMVIDLVVAGTIASLGLLSLPQGVIALPFKVLLFVMVDGWRLLTEALLSSLH